MIADGTRTETGHGLDFLSDPVLVVTVDGQIAEMNTAAKALLGAKLGTGRLADLLADDHEDFRQFLRSGDCAEFCALAHFVTPLGSGLRT